MTINQVADLLKMSRWTVRRYIETGDLRAEPAPRGRQTEPGWHIPVDAYRDFLARHTVTPTAKATP